VQHALTVSLRSGDANCPATPPGDAFAPSRNLEFIVNARSAERWPLARRLLMWRSNPLYRALLRERRSSILKTSDLMTRTVATCKPFQSLEDAARSMWERDIGCVVVVDDEQRPVGMITDRDIAMAAYTRGAPLRDIRVEWAMSKNLSTCSSDAPVRHIESRMNAAQVRRIPLTDSSGRLAGIVSIADIARLTQTSPLHLTELPGVVRTLAGIAERRVGSI